MKLAITQVFLGICIIAGTAFFSIALLPNLLHVVLPLEESSNIVREIEINAGIALTMWILLLFLLGCAVIACGIIQYKRAKN
jgi:hypothetical protein